MKGSKLAIYHNVSGVRTRINLLGYFIIQVVGVLNSTWAIFLIVGLEYTVEPLIKATPEMRPPHYKGHFARSQMCILIKINP